MADSCASDEDQFDWFQRYCGIRHFFTSEYLAPSQIDETKNNYPADSVAGNTANSKPGGQEAPNSSMDGVLNQASTFPPREKCRVLVIGCGNSRLSEDMLSDNWTGGITNVDYSSVVIRKMREKYNDDFYNSLKSRLERERNLQKKVNNNDRSDDKDSAKRKSGRAVGGVKSMLSTNAENKEEITSSMIKMMFECVDVTKSLPFPDDSFDLIICKGALDAILCSPGSIANAASMMEECSRVLDRRHGIMFVVSHGSPDNRLVYFEKPDEGEWWPGGVDVHTAPKPRVGPVKVTKKDDSKNHYIYICRMCDAKERMQDEDHNRLPPIHQSSSNEENISTSVSTAADGVSSMKMQENSPKKNTPQKTTIM
mmetsp:Transcript_4641/g.6786  ORF Transcript_4641/g.6786 Transcript_4641/m.6786 type:complete len:368 (-) Transcript_4641:194-1297(-)